MGVRRAGYERERGNQREREREKGRDREAEESHAENHEANESDVTQQLSQLEDPHTAGSPSVSLGATK